MAEDPLATLFEAKVRPEEEPPTGEEQEKKEGTKDTEGSHTQESQPKGEGDGKGSADDVAVRHRVRRCSNVLGPAEAGCYLSFDEQQKKWIGVWSATVVDDVVAYLRPKIKVPQFKYSKKEKVVFKSEAAATALRDERKDFFRGLCLFIKLAKEFKGDFLLISKADLDVRKVRLFALTDQKEVKALDTEDVYYDASNLMAAAVVTASATSVYTAKTMELPTFVAEAGREGGVAVSFER